MALGDKVDELLKSVATLMERLDNARNSVDVIFAAQREMADALAGLRQACMTEITLLKREVEELRKWKDEHKKEWDEKSRRIWAFGPNIVGAIISGLIAAAVAYFIARR